MIERIRKHIKSMNPKTVAMIGRGMGIPDSERMAHVEKVVLSAWMYKRKK